MKTKKTVLKELLFYFCDLCNENGIEYSFAGESALAVLDSGNLPANFNRITVALPYGQIQKLVSLVNDHPDGRHTIRYLLNQPLAHAFRYYLLDNDYKTVNFKKYRGRGLDSALISIIEIEKKVPVKAKKRFENVLNYVNGNEWDISKPASCLRMIKWKLQNSIKGNKKFMKELLDSREKLVGLSDWNDICSQETVVMRKNTIPADRFRDVRTVDVDGHMIRIAKVLTEAEYTKGFYYSVKKMPSYQMDLGPIPSGFMEKEETKRQMDTILKELDTYSDLASSISSDREVIDQMWGTYEMTLDVKEFEDEFDQKKIDEVSRCLENNDIESARKALLPYIKAKRKYAKNNVPFINIKEIEDLVERFNQLKNSDQNA